MSSGNAEAARRLCWAVVLAGTLAGCSSVPDAVNPVSWYRGARDWVAGDDGAQEAAKAEPAKPVPGADKPFPALASVPERPPETSTAAERERASRSLAADRDQARYTDEQIRRQTDDGANRPRRPEPPPAPAGAAPPRTAAGAPPPRAASSTPPQRPSPPSAARPPAPDPAAIARRMPQGDIAPVPATPPPPPKVAAVPPTATPAQQPAPAARPAPQPKPAARPAPQPKPAARPAPQPAPAARPAPQRAAPAPGPQRRGSAPSQPLEFGPPPTDIAIARGAPGANFPAAGAAPPPVPRSAMGAGVPDSSNSVRFPSGVSPVPRARNEAAGIKLATVYFASGSARLGKDDTTAIRRAVQSYRQRGGILTVVGHASSRTKNLNPLRHEMANFAISLDRANVVAREIVRLGVDPSAVRVVAMSDTQPVYQEVMPRGEAGNRRVEIMIDN